MSRFVGFRFRHTLSTAAWHGGKMRRSTSLSRFVLTSAALAVLASHARAGITAASPATQPATPAGEQFALNLPADHALQEAAAAKGLFPQPQGATMAQDSVGDSSANPLVFSGLEIGVDDARTDQMDAADPGVSTITLDVLPGKTSSAFRPQMLNLDYPAITAIASSTSNATSSSVTAPLPRLSNAVSFLLFGPALLPLLMGVRYLRREHEVA